MDRHREGVRQRSGKIGSAWNSIQKGGVTGCMHQWISKNLTDRKARVHVDGTYSRKKTLREGVLQEGVVSPTLFLVFINDIVRDMLPKVLGAICADNLVLWWFVEHLTTNQESRSQTPGPTCPHEEVSRHNMGRRYCDSQETVHW